MTDDRDHATGWRAITATGRATGQGTLPLMPMTIGDMLDAPFVLLRRHLRDVLLFVSIAVVPAQLVSGFLQRGMFQTGGIDGIADDPIGFLFAMDAAGQEAGTFLVTAVNYLVFMPIAVALLSRLAVSSVLGEELTASEVVRAAARRAPTILGTWLIALLAASGVIVLGVVLLAAGGTAAVLGGLLVVLGIPLAFVVVVLVVAAPTVAVVEGVGPLAATRRAARLVRPRFWAVLGTLVLASVVVGLVQAALSALPTMLAFALPQQASWVVGTLGSIIGALVVTPYYSLLAALVYLDARVRREALDVRILASRNQPQPTATGDERIGYRPQPGAEQGPAIG